MKKTLPLILISCLCVTHIGAEENKIPKGTLSVNKNRVSKNEKPYLSWNIVHPAPVIDIISEITPEDEVIVKKKVRVDVYMVGTGVTSHNGTVQHETRTHINLGDGWLHVFTGVGRDVDPKVIRATKVLNPGDKITFRANYRDWRYNSSDEVIALKNGDTPPTNLGQNGGVALEDYLAPYVKNGKLSLSPLDIIYCAELTHTNKNSSGYDIQDSIVLLRFTEISE